MIFAINSHKKNIIFTILFQVRLSLRKIELPAVYQQQSFRKSRRIRQGDNYNNPAVTSDTTTTTSSPFQQPRNGEHDDSGRESPSPNGSPTTVRQMMDDVAKDRSRRRGSHRHNRTQSDQTNTASTAASSSSKPTSRGNSKHAKPTIERLMKLILEQGDTIQQQLTKLR